MTFFKVSQLPKNCLEGDVAFTIMLSSILQQDISNSPRILVCDTLGRVVNHSEELYLQTALNNLITRILKHEI